MELDPAQISSLLLSHSEQLQVEKSRLSGFLNCHDPNYVQTYEAVQHLQASLDQLGLSLSDIPNHESILAVRSGLLQAYKQAQAVLQIHSQKDRFDDPKEKLTDLVELIVEQQDSLNSVSADNSFLFNAASSLVNRNKVKLEGHVEDLWGEIVGLSKTGLTLQHSEKAPLHQVLFMLQRLGLRASKMQSVGVKLSSMLERVLSGEMLEEDSAKLVFQKTKHDGSLVHVLTQTSRLLKFTFAQLCGSDPHIFRELNLPLNSTVLAVIKKRVVDASFRNSLLPVLTEFLQTLRSIDCPTDVLKQVEHLAEDSENAIVSFRCEMLIELVRELILSPDTLSRTISDQTEKWSYSTQQSKADEHEGVFVLPKMQITETAHKLVAALQDFLEEAVSLPTAAVLEMVLAVRTCVQLYYCLRHYSQEANIRNSPAAAALFHNDCIYLSHHLMLITAELGPRLPEEVKSTGFLCEFEPMIRFRAMECFLDLCRETERVLSDKLKFMRTAQLTEHFEELKETLQSAFKQVSTFACSLQSIFSSSDYLRCVGRVVDFAIKALLEKIFSLQQIASNDESALQQLIDQFLGFSSLFMKQDPSLHVSSWEKLELVKQVLENNINGIMKLFSEGRLSKALTASDITKLIEAMFEDSPRRQECLKIMTSGAARS